MPISASSHYYLSTACLHQVHSYCQDDVDRWGEEKRPGQCKFCAAPCICPCHHPSEPVPMIQSIIDNH